jgi:hypothetical protein
MPSLLPSPRPHPTPARLAIRLATRFATRLAALVAVLACTGACGGGGGGRVDGDSDDEAAYSDSEARDRSRARARADEAALESDDAVRAELEVHAVSASPDTLLFALAGPTPGELGEAAREGRTWLALTRPRGLSFAGRALLDGGDGLEPKRATVVYARAVHDDGRKRPPDPALLRLDGTLAADGLAGRVAPVENPGLEVKGLGSIAPADLRLLLGKGIDNLMHLAPASEGGYAEFDTHELVAVVDADGAAVDEEAWRGAIAEARTQASAAPLDPYGVVVRRWRPSAKPQARYFRVSLRDVVLTAQMRLTATEDGRFRWTHESVWTATLAAPPQPQTPPAWANDPPVVVRYREYRAPRTPGRSFWRTLFAPVVLGADIGTALFEEAFDDSGDDEGVVDRVADKR